MPINNKVLPSLSPRLALLASLVPEGASVCDVGTDHGLLPAYLCLSGRASAVYATDVNKLPLERARKNLKRYGADGVKLLLCDGLEGIEPDSVDTVIIAGMGGEVISGIIERCAFLRSSAVTLILQPMTGADELRLYLARNGFDVKTEPAVCEHKKVWSVMQAVYDGVVRAPDPVALLVGRISPQTPEGAAYIEKQYRRCKKCADGLKGIPERGAEYAKWQTLTDALKNVLEDAYGF